MLQLHYILRLLWDKLRLTQLENLFDAAVSEQPHFGALLLRTLSCFLKGTTCQIKAFGDPWLGGIGMRRRWKSFCGKVIFELEKFKQDVEEYVREAQHFLMLSKDLHEKLLHVQRKLSGHVSDLRYKNMQQISEFASKARSYLHRKLQQQRASARQTFQPAGPETSVPQPPLNSQQSTAGSNVLTVETKSTTIEAVKQSSPGAENKSRVPIVGDVVQVSSLGTKATVLKVEPSKGKIVVQAGKLKLKLKFSDIKI